jgi:hypothetical protein
MTAAVITATVVAKQDTPTTIVSGSERRFKTLYLEGPKAAQNDWFLLSEYLSATELTQIAGWRVIREESGNAYEIDVATYDSDDAKLILTEGTAGTAHVFIDYFEA